MMFIENTHTLVTWGFQCLSLARQYVFSLFSPLGLSVFLGDQNAATTIAHGSWPQQNTSPSSPTGPDSVECIDAVGGAAKKCQLLEYLLCVFLFVLLLRQFTDTILCTPSHLCWTSISISRLLRTFSGAPARATRTFSFAIRVPSAMLVAVAFFRQGFSHFFPSLATKSHYVCSRINRYRPYAWE